MLTVDSLKKNGHQTADLSYFPRWKRDDPRESATLLACTMNMGPLPFCHHGFGVKDGGLVTDVWTAFGLERLMRVRQLGYVKHPFVINLDGSVEEGLRFDHTRGMHVLDVMSVIMLIAENNRPQLERLHPRAIELLRFAALTHDTLTPAGGDTIKPIDPNGFDEDACYHRLFSDLPGREERHALCRELGFAWTAAEEIVHGNGLFGTLLDMADKIGYVSRDAGQFIDYCRRGERRLYFPEYPHIAKLVKEDPWIGAWWESVRVDGDLTWVEDGERLGRFLELRLRLFKGLYFHERRTMDIVLPYVVTEFLYRSGRLKRDELLRMSDEQLEERIAEFCGVELIALRKVAPAEMKMESFADEVSARHRERRLIIDGIPFVHVENIGAPLKPALKFLVRGPNGPDLFRRVYRDKTKEIEELCKVKKPFRLCYFREDVLTREHRKALLAFRRERAGLG